MYGLYFFVVFSVEYLKMGFFGVFMVFILMLLYFIKCVECVYVDDICVGECVR